MKCDKCRDSIKEGEGMELRGQTLCENCYIDALSPAKACDPWAVYGAKSFSRGQGNNVELSEIQSRILAVLKETGGAEPGTIIERLQIKPADFEREFATLRHMEKARGELREGKKYFCLW